MRQDMNFFVQFNGKRKTSETPAIALAIFVALVSAFILITFAYNTISIILTNRETAEYKAKLTTPEMVKKIAESTDVNFQIDLLTKYDNGISEVVDAVKSRDIVTAKLLDDISSTKPKEITIANINISNEKVIIQGASTNRVAIAEIEHNLRKLNEFYDIYVSSIAGEDVYTFDITCSLKAVN